jgi:excisionase family DNA binding protein
MALAQMFRGARELSEDGHRNGPMLLSILEAAQKLGIGRTTFYAEVMSGRIRSLKVGSRRLVPASALQEWIDDRLADEADTTLG